MVLRGLCGDFLTWFGIYSWTCFLIVLEFLGEGFRQPWSRYRSLQPCLKVPFHSLLLSGIDGWIAGWIAGHWLLVRCCLVGGWIAGWVAGWIAGWIAAWLLVGWWLNAGLLLVGLLAGCWLVGGWFLLGCWLVGDCIAGWIAGWIAA